MDGTDDTVGNTLMFRALVDSGSQTTKLNIARSTVEVKISGIDARQQAAKDSGILVIGPQKLPVIVLVLTSIACNLLSQSINLKYLNSMKRSAQAEKIFHQPGLVQLLLGADVYEDLFLGEKKKDHGLHYHKYIFGVTGVLPGWSLECCLKRVTTKVNACK